MCLISTCHLSLYCSGKIIWRYILSIIYGKIAHFSKNCIASYAYVPIAKRRVKQQKIEIKAKGKVRRLNIIQALDLLILNSH